MNASDTEFWTDMARDEVKDRSFEHLKLLMDACQERMHRLKPPAVCIDMDIAAETYDRNCCNRWSC